MIRQRRADHSIYQSRITIMARFSEVFRCSGVDESPNVPGKSKVPGMVIPAGGWNIVALEDGERLRVHSENKHIKIEEIEDTTVIKLARLYLNFKLAVQDVDPLPERACIVARGHGERSSSNR